MVVEPPRCPAFALARAERCLPPTARGAHGPRCIFAASRIRSARGTLARGAQPAQSFQMPSNRVASMRV